MKVNNAAVSLAGLAAVGLVAGLLLLFVTLQPGSPLGGTPLGPLSGVALAAAGAYGLALLPRVLRDAARASGPFVPVASPLVERSEAVPPAVERSEAVPPAVERSEAESKPPPQASTAGLRPSAHPAEAANRNPEVQALAASLTEALRGTPYRVSMSPDAVRVAWNALDYDIRMLFDRHRVQETYTTIIAQTGRPGVWVKRDGLDRFDVTTGVLHGAAWRTMRAGSITRVAAQKEVSFGVNGPEIIAETFTDSRVVDRAVRDALARVGGRVRRDATASAGIAFGIAGVICAIYGLSVAFR